MLVLNLPFKALMFLTLMRPSLVLFLVLWLKLVKDFLKVRCRLALLPRSEERRVGKECRSRWLLEHNKKKDRKREMSRAPIHRDAEKVKSRFDTDEIGAVV